MAALVAGVQYGLSSSGNFVENKELIFVKLTESAVRAIEDYLKNKNNKSTPTPTIQFLGNDGHLSFPTCRGDAARFNFSLSSNQDIEGPQGSFECIQQTGSRCLESMGAVHCKMRIMAKDDVYEATRHRMAAAEEKHKQNCTREIEMDKAGMGRKYRRSKPSASIPPRSGVQQSHSYAPAALAHTKPQGNNHAQKPGNPDIMRRTIRDRLIHMLAVKPYKKPELYSVINREGIRERDRTHLMSTLMNIATVRDNTYHLMRHVWNDVQEDWPFYSEQDRQMLKRRKPQNLTPPGSSDGGSSAGSGQSPSSVHPGSPPSTIEAPPLKRPGYYSGADGLPTKRPRIAHSSRKPDDVFRRSESPVVVKREPDWRSESPALTSSVVVKREPDWRSESPALTSSVVVKREPDWRSESPALTSSMKRTDDWRTESQPVKREVDWPSSVKRETERDRTSMYKPSNRYLQVGGAVGGALPPTRQDKPPPQPDSTTSPEKDRGRTSAPGPVPDLLPTTKTPLLKFQIDYTPIKTTDQRRKYKEDFNNNYNEYRRLHTIVAKVATKFSQLEQQLNSEEKDSPAYKEIKNQILKEYQESKKDKQHLEARRRFQYLHEKLSHIKRLVLEYDNAHLNHPPTT